MTYRRFRFLIVISVVVAAAGLTTFAAVQSSDNTRQAEAALQAAMNKETVQGDTKGSIEDYIQIVAKYPNARAVVAKALVRMGQSYERLGDGQARPSYERVIRDYADQKEASAVARARLGRSDALARASDKPIWIGPDVPEPAYASVSPDSRYVSYLDQTTGDLALRDLAAGTSRRLTDKGTWQQSSEMALESAISRDGQHIAYNWSTGKGQYQLRVLPLKPGATAQPRVLHDGHDGDYVVPSEWSSDGRLIAVQTSRSDRSTQIGLVRVQDGSRVPLKSLGWRGSSRLALSPDGAYLAYDIPASDTTIARDVFVLATDGSREVPILVGSSRDQVAGWSADGRYLLVLSDRRGPMSLWGQRMAAGRPQGDPVLLQTDMRGVPLGTTQSSGLHYYVVTRDQTMQAVTVDFATGQRVAATWTPALDTWASNRRASWSPDGKSIAYISSRPRAVTDLTLSIQSLQTGVVRELPLKATYVHTYDWAPDGLSFVARAVDLKGREGIYRIDANTAELTPIVLKTSEFGYFTPHWVDDVNTLYYTKGNDNQIGAFVERDLRSGAEREVFRQDALRIADGTTFPGVRDMRLSPNKRYVAGLSPGPGYSTLWVITVADGTARELLRVKRQRAFTQNGGLRWTPDSTALVVNHAAAEGGQRYLSLIPLAGSGPRTLDVGAANLADSAIAIHPDGKQVAFIAGEAVKIEFRVLEHVVPSGK